MARGGIKARGNFGYAGCGCQVIVFADDDGRLPVSYTCRFCGETREPWVPWGRIEK